MPQTTPDRAQDRAGARCRRSRSEREWLCWRLRVPPFFSGASGHSNSAPAFRSSAGPNVASNTLERVAGSRNSVVPCSRYGGPSVTCCVHPIGRSMPARFSTDSRTRTRRPSRSNPSSNDDLRERQGRAHRQGLGRAIDLISGDGRFPVSGHPGGGFLVGGAAENVEAQVVTHDSGEQPCVGARTVERFMRVGESRRLNRRPRRPPQRVDARGLVDDGRDVATLLEDHDAEDIVLDDRGPAVVVDLRRHGAADCTRCASREWGRRDGDRNRARRTVDFLRRSLLGPRS